MCALCDLVWRPALSALWDAEKMISGLAHVLWRGDMNYVRSAALRRRLVTVILRRRGRGRDGMRTEAKAAEGIKGRHGG